MKDLLEEYKQTLAITKNMRKTATNEEEMKTINTIIRELQHVVKWLEAGREPTYNKTQSDYLTVEGYKVMYEDRGTISFFDNPFLPNMYELVEMKIDEERGRKKNA